MSIKLRYERGPTSTQVTLNDEAIVELLKLIAKYKLEGPIELGGDYLKDLSDQNKESERLAFARAWLGERSPAQVLAQVGWETFPERILLLGAHYETTNGIIGWQDADIGAKFNVAKAPPPENFVRDVFSAITAGIITAVTPSTYKVSRTGWLKVYEAIIKVTIAKDLAPGQNRK
jgi:hypothetical protein